MLRIITGLLLIFIMINGGTSQLLLKLIDEQRTLDWDIEQDLEINDYKNPNITKEGIVTVLQKVGKITVKLHALDAYMNVMKCDDVSEKLSSVDRIFDAINQSPTKKLCGNIKVVHHFFDELRKYEWADWFSNETLRKFSRDALWGDNSLQDSLEAICELFTPNILSPELVSLMLQRSEMNLQNDCDMNLSPQQQLYYIYIHLIISEMKGLVTTQRIYLMKRYFNENSVSYIAELEYTEMGFRRRLEEYYRVFHGHVDLFAQHVRRCDVKRHERGVNTIELEKFSRFTFLDSKFGENYFCRGCPNLSQIRDISALINTTIYNCINLGSTVISCAAEPDSPRDYWWWLDKNGASYGDMRRCDKIKVNQGKSRMRWRNWDLPLCTMCACSIDQNSIQKDDTSTNWRISVTDQVSDFRNNMVVTGVRFVVHNNTLHLQIHQANFSHNGIVFNNNEWKQLDIGISDNDLKPTRIDMPYEYLRYSRKSLYMDDIKVPEGSVVTGVRFRLADDSAFKLEILATPFEFRTGVLFPSGNAWVDSSASPMSPKDYQRNRIEIELDNSDYPAGGVQFGYDLESNKLVKFTHTDIHKDAGQTTIPLIDAQPVITQPSFPLSGIGLSYRGREGFGGYIAPRIYTIGVTNYLKFLPSSE